MNFLKLNTSTFLLIICCILQMSAQEYYYYYKGEKIFLELNTEYIFVSGANKDNIQRMRSNSAINTANFSELKQDFVSQTLNKPSGVVERSHIRYWQEINLRDNISPANYLAEIQKMRTSNKDVIVAPYFKTASTDKLGLSNYFYVRLKDQDDFSLLQDMIEQYEVDLVGQNKFRPLSYTLSVTPNSLNAIQMAATFYESGLFEHAGPDLMFAFSQSSASDSSNPVFVPNDTYYEDQWHLNNSENEDIDIKAENAWDITKGHRGVSTAVISDGIEMDHPDLVNNIVGNGFDATSGTSPAQAYQGYHGPACGGLIAAEGNNNMGISGVAPNSRLISVSVDFGVGGTQILADGIDWAWRNGADIISNSWNLRGSSVPPTSEIEVAINNALTNGRNGLGCVVVFSSGNNNIDGAQYPANAIPDILCVGGIDRCGIRSAREDIIAESCEPWCEDCVEGSSFGDALDVVAAGTAVITADSQGDAPNTYFSAMCTPGFTILGDLNPNECSDNVNYNNPDYTNDFSGTSAACPIVAGVAALVLSVNPALTVQEVGKIIEETAQKIQPDDYNYTYENVEGRDHGTWNNEVGYGLVNAYQAVLKAQQSLVCKENVTVEANTVDNTTLLHTYASGNKISTRQTSSDEVDVLINETEVVDFKSEHIQLNAGFKVNSGACLNAVIAPCE